MKIQKFQITIAIPDDTDFVDVGKFISLIRDYSESFNACDCAMEVKEIEKYTEVK